MGDITHAIDSLGEKTMNILESRSETKHNKEVMYQNYVKTTQKRKNLLEEQLARRRARLGASGLSVSSSSRAAEQREVKKIYDDVLSDTQKYKQDAKYQDKNYKSKLYRELISLAGDASKMIK